MTDCKEDFLNKNSAEIKQSTRNPLSLADELYGKNFISNEMYSKIKTQTNNADKMREIYEHLNSTKHYDYTYDWLKENEPHLIEELEKSNTEDATPQKKRARLENEDETDRFPSFPSSSEFETGLSKISTFAKLERWVSKAEISQKLISDLEGKLGDEGMERLKKELKDKEPKKSICLNAYNIDDIRKNKELVKFLSATKSENIPKLIFNMFFKKGGSSGNKDQSSTDYEEYMDVTADSSSSGYESLNSSLNNGCSQLSSGCSPQNAKRLADEGDITVSSHTGDLDIMIQENEDNGSRYKTTEQIHSGTSGQMQHEVKADAPLQGPTDVQGVHTDEVEEQSQTLDVPMHEESSTEKATRLEDTCGSMDIQETHIHEMKEQPQRLNVPNVPSHTDVSLHQIDQIPKKEMQDKHVDEMDEEPQRSNVPDVSRSEDIPLIQNDPITKKTPPLEEDLGSMDMQGAYIDKMEEPCQRSNVPINTELITKTAAPKEDICGSKDVEETHIHEMKELPQRSNVPNVPSHTDVSLHQIDQITKTEVPLEYGSGSMDLQDAHIDETDEERQTFNVPKHEDETITKKATTQVDGVGSLDMEDANTQKMDDEPQRSDVPMRSASLHQDESSAEERVQKNSPGSASAYTQNNGTDKHWQHKDTPAPKRGVKDPLEAAKKREKTRLQREKKIKEKDKLLRDWALRQCKDSKEDLKNILEHISVINMAEHHDYPCFTAENVMVYKYLTPESQIIFIADDNASIRTTTMVYYHMFVCNIHKAILLGPKKPYEKEFRYEDNMVPVKKCKDLIFKVFAPVLTVYKQIQREEKFYSLV